jgi:hypothetical protein
MIDVNASLKRFDPQFWLPFLTFAWGVASVAQGLVTNHLAFEFVSISKRNVSQRDALNPNLQCLEPPKLVYSPAWCSYSLSITYGEGARIYPIFGV